MRKRLLIITFLLLLTIIAFSSFFLFKFYPDRSAKIVDDLKQKYPLQNNFGVASIYENGRFGKTKVLLIYGKKIINIKNKTITIELNDSKDINVMYNQQLLDFMQFKNSIREVVIKKYHMDFTSNLIPSYYQDNIVAKVFVGLDGKFYLINLSQTSDNSL